MKKHTKRYMVIFSMWGKSPTNKYMEGLDGLKEFAYTETEFDTEAEWNEEVKLIEEVYADTPRPHTKKVLRGKYYENVIEFNQEDRIWGYIVLDFDKSSIIRLGGNGIFEYHRNKFKYADFIESPKVTLNMLDEYFRGDDEIPQDYQFDFGEYDGWLQYRWGDGKNAVKCNQPTCKKPTKKKYGKHEPLTQEEIDEILSE